MTSLLTCSIRLVTYMPMILVKGKDINVIEACLNAELANMSRCFDANKLALNIVKTKIVHFRYPRNLSKNVSLNVSHNDVEIENIKVFKYLGVYVDQHLSFEDHISRACSKVSSRTGLLWRIRCLISKDLAC